MKKHPNLNTKQANVGLAELQATVFSKGSLTEIFGSGSSGKTLFALALANQCLAMGGAVAWLSCFRSAFLATKVYAGSGLNFRPVMYDGGDDIFAFLNEPCTYNLLILDDFSSIGFDTIHPFWIEGGEHESFQDVLDFNERCEYQRRREVVEMVKGYALMNKFAAAIIVDDRMGQPNSFQGKKVPSRHPMVHWAADISIRTKIIEPGEPGGFKDSDCPRISAELLRLNGQRHLADISLRCSILSQYPFALVIPDSCSLF